MRRGKGISINRLVVFGVILSVSIIAFEVYNFDSTRYSLTTFFGEASFMGIPWATILALAFCGVDFAGVAKLFTPQQGRNEPKEVWWLFGAWFLASIANAFLTWWAVLSILNADGVTGNALVSSEKVMVTVPILIAVMVWLARLLLIGVTAFSGDRLLHPAAAKISYDGRNSSSHTPKGRVYRQNQSAQGQSTTQKTLDELLK